MSAEKHQNIFVDAFAFMLNVASSVLIIFVNKQLMRPPEAGGAGFNFCTFEDTMHALAGRSHVMHHTAVTLCALHYIGCSFYMWVLQAMGKVKRVDVPLQGKDCQRPMLRCLSDPLHTRSCCLHAGCGRLHRVSQRLAPREQRRLLPGMLMSMSSLRHHHHPRSPSSSSSPLCALSSTSGLAAAFPPPSSLPSPWWPSASALCTSVLLRMMTACPPHVHCTLFFSFVPSFSFHSSPLFLSTRPQPTNRTVSGDTSARNLFGTIVAGMSVIGSGMQQILCRSVQQKNSLSSQEMLLRVAPLQGITLLLLGPPLDYYVTKGAWVTEYQWTGMAMFWMLLSCSVAILVNISQFMTLGRFTAVTYQVLGHSKTILVLLGGWLIFREVITPKQAGGMAMAVAGMVWCVGGAHRACCMFCAGMAARRARKSPRLPRRSK